jgi:hypothetical protein
MEVRIASFMGYKSYCLWQECYATEWGNPQRGKGTDYLQLIAERASLVTVGLFGRAGDGRSCQPRSDCGFASQYDTMLKHELTFADLVINNK